jgi:hypothetical protein
MTGVSQLSPEHLSLNTLSVTSSSYLLTITNARITLIVANFAAHVPCAARERRPTEIQD